jgi:uncharacterized protein YdhG (YjbR/CyaY superfamily)
VQSSATTVDAYMEEAPADRREVLERLRALCRESLPGFEEGMAYGMPVVMRGEQGIAFASQKRYISLYVEADVLEAHADQLRGPGVELGKGCIRYARPDRIDFALVESMLRATASRAGQSD